MIFSKSYFATAPLQKKLFHQRHRNIVDIGAGGTGQDQAVHGPQGMVGVVRLQRAENVQPFGPQRGGGAVVHITSGSVGGIRTPIPLNFK